MKIKLLVAASLLLVSCVEKEGLINEATGKTGCYYYQGSGEPMIEKLCLDMYGTALINDRVVAHYAQQGTHFSLILDGLPAIFNSMANYEFDGGCFSHVDNEANKFCKSKPQGKSGKQVCEQAGWHWEENVQPGMKHCTQR